MALGSDTQLKLPGVLNDKVLCFSNQLGMIMTSVSKDQMVMGDKGVVIISLC